MGAKLAAAESARNLVCSGALPLAATNCLNFGNPENPEVMWQFTESVKGIKEACEILNTPITGGNVSLYNETNGTAIFPTPVLGMVGKITDVQLILQSHFKNLGDSIYLLGNTHAELGGSIYLEQIGSPLCGPCPNLDLIQEKALQDKLLKLNENRLIESAHDLSEGGLLLSLAECCFPLKYGLKVDISTSLRPDHFLFSETPSRILVSVAKDNEEKFLQEISDLSFARLGEIVDENFELKINGEPLISLPTTNLYKKWDTSLDEVLKH
jgi:phosphoribosylformylglycinamidine synthase